MREGHEFISEKKSVCVIVVLSRGSTIGARGSIVLTTGMTISWRGAKALR